jgi:hypothetical protein
MKDIVLIPTYLRAEYLYLCLEHLSVTERTESVKEIWVCEDRRQDDEYRYKMLFEWTDEVINAWRGPLNITKFVFSKHIFTGNSRNVLESYKQAFHTNARYVYLVEDDVLVKPDFFRWHEAAQAAEPTAMCSIAYRCSRNGEARTDVTDPAAYFTTARDYASIGVCWKRENLEPVITHACNAYYENTEAYVRKAFPGNRFEADFSEQDGLIMRVMWDQRGFTTWCYVPRAYHLGWFGYHRPNGKRPNGFWQQKVGEIRSIISDPDRLKQAAPDFGDIEPFPRGPVAEWSGPLQKLQHFE